MKTIQIFCCALCLLFLFSACKSKMDSVTTVPTTTQITTTTVPATQPPETTTKVAIAESTTRKVKYGDCKLTTNTDNPFVDAVVAKYGISREGLVCIYFPEGREGNYVWQFDNSKDANGKYIRTADTLKYVYAVSADYQTVSRTGGKTGNDGCTLKDGLTVFLLTQKVLLPNLQDQL